MECAKAGLADAGDVDVLHGSTRASVIVKRTMPLGSVFSAGKIRTLLTLISLWQGAPILESVFNWPGLGSTIVQAIGLYETPVIVGTTVVFAYLLALTVFLLDFVYALVDPRVKVGSGN